MTTFERARKYVAAMDDAVSGAGGHDRTYSVACTLVEGFNLPEPDAWSILSEFNARCQPPWAEHELRHKLGDACRNVDPSKRGHLLGPNGRKRHQDAPATPFRTQYTPEPSLARPALNARKRQYDLSQAGPLPEPMPDSTRALLRHLFLDGEGVRIAPAKLDDAGHEIPDSEGITLPLAQWMERLDKHHGNPNGIFSSTKKTGIYITINPMRPGSAGRDADVTDHRHALIESDSLPVEQQLELYRQSRIPCAAIIHSGGKSVHAWVKIGARDKREYVERVAMLYAHFEAAGFPIDTKNKNPSRFSRLPNCVRFAKRQELLALDMGCASWEDWLAEMNADGVGVTLSLDDLENYDVANDSASIIGQRWLCRGGSCLLIGPSGVGKSSLAIQLALAWSVGRPMFGIAPARPLKVLVVQAENDTGDLAEMVLGVRRGLGIDPFTTEVDYEALRSNLVFVRDTSHTGEAFTEALRTLIRRHKPDLVVFDPLLSFIGADISKQEVCSQFLRNWLNPIAEATGVAWLCVHHTGKPPNDPKQRKSWTMSDYSYAGIGSSELTNWTRATMILEPINNQQFRLMLSKRGKRAGATHLDGEPTNTIYLSHSHEGIYWQQLVQPEEPQEEERPKRREKEENPAEPTKLEKLMSLHLGTVCDAIPKEGVSLRELVRRIVKHASEHGLAVSETLVRGKDNTRGAIDQLTANGLIVSDGKMWFGKDPSKA